MDKVYGVDPCARHHLLQGASGRSDAFLDLRGSKYLPPRERAIVNARHPGASSLPIEKISDNVDTLPPWWWNPSNPQATSLPAGVSISKYNELVKAFRAIDPKIGITWHGVRNIWQVWYHKPGFTTYGNGWVMVKEFKPYHNVAYMLEVVNHMDSTKTGTASERYRKSEEALKAHKEKVRKQLYQNDLDAASAAYDYTLIKNIGLGSKSVTYG